MLEKADEHRELSFLNDAEISDNTVVELVRHEARAVLLVHPDHGLLATSKEGTVFLARECSQSLSSF